MPPSAAMSHSDVLLNSRSQVLVLLATSVAANSPSRSRLAARAAADLPGQQATAVGLNCRFTGSGLPLLPLAWHRAPPPSPPEAARAASDSEARLGLRVLPTRRHWSPLQPLQLAWCVDGWMDGWIGLGRVNE